MLVVIAETSNSGEAAAATAVRRGTPLPPVHSTPMSGRCLVTFTADQNMSIHNLSSAFQNYPYFLRDAVLEVKKAKHQVLHDKAHTL